MRRPLVAGNWKMHGTRASVAALLAELAEQSMPAGVEIAVFPGLIHLQAVIAGVAGPERQECQLWRGCLCLAAYLKRSVAG